MSAMNNSKAQWNVVSNPSVASIDEDHRGEKRVRLAPDIDMQKVNARKRRDEELLS